MEDEEEALEKAIRLSLTAHQQRWEACTSQPDHKESPSFSNPSPQSNLVNNQTGILSETLFILDIHAHDRGSLPMKRPFDLTS